MPTSSASPPVSDSTDPEHVREFLARYFELCREIVERYGGTVEKFIGDAVMAVWGTPVAQEDDAERAVRTALDLVDAVRHLGRQGGDEALELRAGVLTGEAAVTIGAVGQGMVAGDMVNTASRLQSVAPPGTVLVGEATKRAAAEAIAFEPAGEQLLKGKAAPVPAWRALRVVAERGGQGRSEGIEAPFVGRDDELRLLKDFLHATSRERRVRLLSVTGQGGIGKSRLAWELLKYIDGVSEDIYWHQGRSPSFGEGVTFWALGEMIRRRAGLREDDDDATTRERIAAALEEFVDDEAERRQIEPALLSLLGVGDSASGGREELFTAWRTFFERISLKGTTILVFEDLQWADAGLMEFIDHLLEWSIGYPILVITLARPDLLERRPDWGAGRRNFVALALGPLSDAAMRDLLAGLVPGLPASTVRAILQRADGIPLYAVETIRMLVEDGKLEEADGAYRVIGDLGQLQVPDTLHALIAARLDAVDPADRALIQDGSVLGQSFSVAALAALTGEPEEALESRLRGLVHREILQLDTDPRSPERGQFGFTQALVREVAYSTLGRRDRRAKHLAAARYYESLGDEEVAGVLATHYVDAYQAAPEGPEGEAVATQARLALRGAADRATALGAHESAIMHWERARTVTSDPVEEADLLEKIGLANRNLGHFAAAQAAYEDALARYQALDDRVGSARASLGLGRALGAANRLVDSMPIVEAAAEEIADLAPHQVLVELWFALASGHSQLGQHGPRSGAPGPGPRRRGAPAPGGPRDGGPGAQGQRLLADGPDDRGTGPRRSLAHARRAGGCRSAHRSGNLLPLPGALRRRPAGRSRDRAADRGAVSSFRARTAAPDDAHEHGRSVDGGGRVVVAGGRARHDRPGRARVLRPYDVRPRARRAGRRPRPGRVGRSRRDQAGCARNAGSAGGGRGRGRARVRRPGGGSVRGCHPRGRGGRERRPECPDRQGHRRARRRSPP